MFSAINTKVRLAGLAALAVAAVLPAAAGATAVSSSVNITAPDVSGAVPFSVSFGSTINPTTQSSTFTGLTANTYTSTLGGTTASTTVSSTTGVAFTSTYVFSLTGSYYETANLLLSGNNAITGSTFELYKYNSSTGTYVADSSIWVTNNDKTLSGYLTTGTYELVVTGTSTAGSVASFSGNLSVSAAPIPAALPLFGSALVAVGLFGRRRNKRQAVAAV